MRFSLAMASQRVVEERRSFDHSALRDECHRAEAAGFYAAYTGERRATGPTSYSHSPLITAAYMLANTTTLRVGAGLVVLPLHHPIAVIQDAAVLDAMYPGRFRLAVGAGYTDADFEALGVPLSERGSRMESGLAAIDAYRHGRVEDLQAPYRGRVPVRDEALGRDHLDVFAGGWSIAGVRRAARYADGWLTGPLDTISALAEMVAVYRDECARLGRRSHVAVLREAWMADSDDEARRVYGDYVLAYHRIYLQRGKVYDPRFDPWIHEVASPDDLTLDHVLPDRVLCGSPDTWITTLDAWQELVQPDEIVLRLRHVDGPSSAQVCEVIDRIGAEILPRYSGGTSR